MVALLFDTPILSSSSIFTKSQNGGFEVLFFARALVTSLIGLEIDEHWPADGSAIILFTFFGDASSGFVRQFAGIGDQKIG